MSSLATTSADTPLSLAAPSDHPLQRAMQSGRIVVGGGVLLAILFLCVGTLPLTLNKSSSLYFDAQNMALSRQPPSRAVAQWFGTDALGRSILGRCLLGGSISLLIGVAAAMLSIFLGVSVGLVSGYKGGWIDALLMRSVDIFYGLPYILLIILIKIAFQDKLTVLLHNPYAANLVILFTAIGLVSWLTMARVVRGQVLSLRSQPFVEACRASGLTETRIFLRHILPNLTGPIIVYATLTIPQAILQESFLSFLGIGIAKPMPTWGDLASEGLMPALNPINSNWWMLLFPCTLLAVTLLSLNFVGDGLRDLFDPRRGTSKI